LSARDAPSQIVQDFSLSEAGLRSDWDRQLREIGQVGLREAFLQSPPHVLRETLTYLRSRYGSINGYLDHIGFGPDDRDALRRALLEPVADGHVGP